MTGIMVAAAGGTKNVIYANGLYNTTLGVDTSPIQIGNQSSFSGPITLLSYQWIGYYRPVTSTAVTLGATCNYAEYLSIDGFVNPLSWSGGEGYSLCWIWIGSTALSGFAPENALATIINGTSGANFTGTAGLYYPIRVQWQTVLPYQQFSDEFSVYTYFAESNFTLLIGGSSNVTSRVWYNTLTNGF